MVYKDNENIFDLVAYWTWMGADGIARSQVKPNAEVGISEAMENSKSVNSLYIDRKFPLLINVTGIKSITKEARKHFAVKGRDSNITAFAVVVESELSRIVANFFFSLNPTGVPAKLFTNEEKALIWLRQYL